MSKIAKESIFQLLPRNARFYPTANVNVLSLSAELPKHFVLRPGRPITVLQGQEANVKCESEGVTTTKLQWKKQTISGEVPVPDSMVTIVKDRSTNRIRAILTIANAQKKDDGLYKCVLGVTFFDKTAFRLIRIQVKGNSLCTLLIGCL